MTKTQEIKLLKRTIRQFGPNSYIGSWLAAHEDKIIWCIRNDFPIELDLLYKSKHPPIPWEHAR